MADYDSTSLDSPSAFSFIQPVKAALYYDAPDGFGDWRILVAGRAEKDLRQARKRDKNSFRIYLKKIKELSNGHFSDDNQKKLTGTRLAVPIFEAKMTGDTRLVYHVDCISDMEGETEYQALRILGIFTHAQLERGFWEYAAAQLGRKGPEYRKRCCFRRRPKNKGDNVFMPESWPKSPEAASEPASAIPVLRTGDSDQESYDVKFQSIWHLEKSVALSKPLLYSIVADQDVAHVFDVSAEEHKIISHSSSCYVMGRSGTGKTTTMLFKMLRLERATEEYEGIYPKCRQLFVTQSRVLAEKVEEYYSKLQQSLAISKYSLPELAEIAHKRDQQGRRMVDHDEEVNWRNDLPVRYGELKDEHFPMFVTYDQLCTLLENEFAYNDANYRRQQGGPVTELRGGYRSGPSESSIRSRKQGFVSYETFLSTYWPHFPENLTTRLDPAFVFGEIIGVIKGSEETLDFEDGYLDCETYCGDNPKCSAAPELREDIYWLFQRYLRVRKERWGNDAADRTHGLIKRLRETGVPGPRVDFLYVDEVQDNLLIDALVLRMLCRNPQGLFWAGDSAQTISAGSAFRFNDLKAFMYRIEEKLRRSEKRVRDPIQPELFRLMVNYRSHAGIVNAARSVIQVITQFWPQSIDILPPERGTVDGAKPVFYTGLDEGTFQFEQFLFGGPESKIEFGAEQCKSICILVRDKAARDGLLKLMGRKIGMIMTLAECKGLEFNDVLLYNFFADSTASTSQWNLVLNLVPSSEDRYAPCFDKIRHHGLCRELKFLYVAITRARKNLWIADRSQTGEAMRVLWTAQQQVQNVAPGVGAAPKAVESTKDEWAEAALSMFLQHRYAQAIHCYSRAGMKREEAIANAYYLRDEAHAIPVAPRSDPRPRNHAFTQAAEAFLASAHDASGSDAQSYLRNAAQCYAEINDDVKAGQAYRAASLFTLAAEHFRKAGDFDDAVDVIKSHRDEMDAGVADSIEDVSRLYYLRENKMNEARELFTDADAVLEYTDDYGLDQARHGLLEELGRFAEAAELRLVEGNTLEAIRLYSRDTFNVTSLRKAHEAVLDGFWQHLSLGVTVSQEYLSSNATLRKLLELTEELGGEGIDENLRDEVAMFRAIVQGRCNTLLALGDTLLMRRNNPLAAFLCMDYYFSTPPDLVAAQLPSVCAALQKFVDYAQRLREFARTPYPSTCASLRRLLALTAPSEETILVPHGAALSSLCSPEVTPGLRITDNGMTVPRWELDRVIWEFLRGRLLDRVRAMEALCANIHVLQPCLLSAAYGTCKEKGCPLVQEDMQQYDTGTYNTRVRVHLQQVLAWQTTFGLQTAKEYGKGQRDWLRRLYEALFPPYHNLGSVHLLVPDLIPELPTSLRVLRTWLQDRFYYLRADDYTFLSELLRWTSVAFTLDQRNTAEMFHRWSFPGWLQIPGSPPPEYRRLNGEYVVHDMLAFMETAHADALDRGVLFLNHILKARIPIRVGVLCDFIERICLYICIVHGRLGSHAPLHGAILPKSWILRGIAAAGELSSIGLRSAPFFIDHMGALLREIYEPPFDSSWDLKIEKPHSWRTPVLYRSALIARICRALCLLGSNMTSHTTEARRRILTGITSLRQPGRFFNRMIDGYVNARRWEQMESFVRYSGRDSKLDGMVLLHHDSHPVLYPPPRYVTRVLFNRVVDIPLALGGQSVAVPTVPPPIPPPVEHTQARNQASPNALEDKSDQEQDRGAPAEEEGPADDDLGVEQADEPPEDASHPIEDTTGYTLVKYNAQAIAAANTFARAYRQLLLRRHQRMDDARRDPARARVLSAFLSYPHEEGAGRSYYRFLFRGPVAHAFLVAERIKEHLRAVRDEAKARIQAAGHHEFEVLQASLNDVNPKFKTAVRIHKDLHHESAMHARRDLEALKTCIRELDELYQSLPLIVVSEWNLKHDLNLATRGIVKVGRPAKRARKPQLRVEDDRELVYSYESYLL